MLRQNSREQIHLLVIWQMCSVLLMIADQPHALRCYWRCCSGWIDQCGKLVLEKMVSSSVEFQLACMLKNESLVEIIAGWSALSSQVYVVAQAKANEFEGDPCKFYAETRFMLTRFFTPVPICNKFVVVIHVLSVMLTRIFCTICSFLQSLWVLSQYKWPDKLKVDFVFGEIRRAI